MPWGHGTRGQTIDTPCPHLSPSVPGQQGQIQNTDQLTLVICLGDTGHGDKLLTHRVPICPHLSWDNRDKLKTGHLTLVICLWDTGHGNKLLARRVPICPGTTGTNSKHGPAKTCNMSWEHGTREQTIDTSCPHLSRDNRDKLKTDLLTLVICLGDTGTNYQHIVSLSVLICPGTTGTNSKPTS